jgi:predicted transcriptional regulator
MADENNEILDPKEFGREVKAQRRAMGLSQEKFGVLIGLAQSDVSFLERGELDAPVDSLRRVKYRIGLLRNGSSGNG